MGLLTSAKFKEIADSLSKQQEILTTAIGDESTPATVQYGIDQNLQRVMGLDDFDPMYALLKSGGEAKTLGHALNLAKNYQKDILKALDNHLGGLDMWLTTNDVRVHPYFEDVAEHCGFDLSAANVFPPAIDTGTGLGRITKGSPDTFTDGVAINTNLYGKANLYAQITNVGDASVTWTIEVTCKKIDETTETKQVTFTAAALNATAPIGILDVDMYIDITNITTISGGTTNDAITIYSSEERTISL